MKSILYAGAALMIGASIYGFVDYNKTSHKKEFKTMYAEPKESDADNNAEIKKVAANDSKNESPAVTETKKADDNKSVTSNTTKKITKKTVKKNRVFSTRLFSRGALDERYINPTEKEEPKKTEDKEQ